MLDKVINFCHHFRDDWDETCLQGRQSNPIESDPAELEKKIQKLCLSLFHRALGVAFGLASLTFALKALVVISSSPLAALIAEAVAAIFFALAHDFIMIGESTRIPTPDTGMEGRLGVDGPVIKYGVRNASDERQFDGTWIVGPLQGLD